MTTNAKRIFVVEDEAIVAKDLELRLHQMGYQVVGIAASGESTMAQLSQNSADIVLMDIHLKGAMDGIETAAWVRKTLDIPVVFLTAYADNATLERAKLTDPFGYILKPFEERALQINIEIAIHKYQGEKQLKVREQWIESVLNSISNSIIATDINGLITYSNLSADALLGHSPAIREGQCVLTAIRFYDEAGTPMSSHPVELVLRKGTPQLYDQIGVKVGELPIKFIQLSITGLKNHNDTLIGAVLGFSDISRRRQTERDLKLAQYDVDTRIEESSKSLRKKLETAQLQLSLSRQTVKQLRKIERRYIRITGGDKSDE